MGIESNNYARRVERTPKYENKREQGRGNIKRKGKKREKRGKWGREEKERERMERKIIWREELKEGDRCGSKRDRERRRVSFMGG